MANYKPEEITALVDNHYELTEPLRTRMDDDHKLYRLEEFDAGDFRLLRLIFSTSLFSILSV